MKGMSKFSVFTLDGSRLVNKYIGPPADTWDWWYGGHTDISAVLGLVVYSAEPAPKRQKDLQPTRLCSHHSQLGSSCSGYPGITSIQ